MSQVRHVIFDLGKVLIDYSYRRLFPLLRRRGAQICNVDDFAAQVRLSDYEHGRISNAEFLQGINALLRKPLDADELQSAWCGIFTPIPQMLQLARQLRQRYKIFIISNTSEIHWHYLRQRFQLDSLCDGALASFEIGWMKPEPELYRSAEKRLGFSPAEAIFIDDRLNNVAGAEACGWQAIQHHNYGQTCDALNKLGIDLSG